MLLSLIVKKKVLHSRKTGRVILKQDLFCFVIFLSTGASVIKQYRGKLPW
jgi:hypothetical protein